MSSTNSVLVVDCTDFTGNTANNYKLVPVNQAFPMTPELKFSRYEVLRESIRKIYFDIDGMPEAEDVEDKPDKFVKAWGDFMVLSGFLEHNDLKWVKTLNHHSTNHKGFSAHVIVWNYQMNTTDLKNSVIMFLETEQGREFREYVDVAVYSSLRLFKLPNFIGIPMTDVNNYHTMDPRDNDMRHYLIQDLTDTTQIVAHFKVPRNLRRKAKQISPAGNVIFYKKMVEALDELRQVFVDKHKTENIIKADEVENELNQLLLNDTISESDKIILRRYTPLDENKLAIVNNLCRLVKQKYRL